jgi:hypothetical protein
VLEDVSLELLPLAKSLAVIKGAYKRIELQAQYVSAECSLRSWKIYVEEAANALPQMQFYLV